MAAKMDAIKLLLHSGASVDLKDNDGTTCWSLAKHFPRVNALISEAATEDAKKARAEKRSEGAFKCTASGCTRKGSKRCTGCYLIYFCSDPCFKETWPTHKSKCKETRAQYKTVKLSKKQFSISLNFKSNKVTTSKAVEDAPLQKKHFIVKVQVPQGEDSDAQLMIYNESRSVMGWLERVSAPEVDEHKIFIWMDVINMGFIRCMTLSWALLRNMGSEV